MFGRNSIPFPLKALAGLLLVQLIFLQAFAASPQIHEDCCKHHQDSPADDDQRCAIDLFLQTFSSQVSPQLGDDLKFELSVEIAQISISNFVQIGPLAASLLTCSPPRGP